MLVYIFSRCIADEAYLAVVDVEGWLWGEGLSLIQSHCELWTLDSHTGLPANDHGGDDDSLKAF